MAPGMLCICSINMLIVVIEATEAADAVSELTRIRKYETQVKHGAQFWILSTAIKGTSQFHSSQRWSLTRDNIGIHT